MSFKLVVSYRAYRLKDMDPVVRSEQCKLVRRSAEEVKRLTGERASFDGAKPIKLLFFLLTVQETFDDGGVSEGLAARALYYLLGGEAQDFYSSRVTTGTNPSDGAKPTPFTWPHVIHAIIQRYPTDDVWQEAYDSVTRPRQGADEGEDAFAVRMEASARDCSGVFGQHDLVSYYVQGLPETIRHTVGEKVRSLEHSEQGNLLRVRRIALTEGNTHRARSNSTKAPQKSKERRLALVVPYNQDSSGGRTTQESMTMGYHQDPILLAHGGQGSSPYSTNDASGGSSWVSPYPPVRYQGAGQDLHVGRAQSRQEFQSAPQMNPALMQLGWANVSTDEASFTCWGCRVLGH